MNNGLSIQFNHQEYGPGSKVELSDEKSNKTELEEKFEFEHNSNEFDSSSLILIFFFCLFTILQKYFWVWVRSQTL